MSLWHLGTELGNNLLAFGLAKVPDDALFIYTERPIFVLGDSMGE